MSKNFNEFIITDGDIEIELMLKGREGGGIGVMRGGIPTTDFDPSTYYHHITSEEALLFVENWSIVIKDDCPDDFATLSRRFFSLLIRAWLYKGTQRYKEKGPVWIEQRVRMETNKRFARVHSSPLLRMMQPLFNHEFEMAGLISEIGFPIARFAWETAAPGTIPTTKNNFDKTNGGSDPATIVPVANHYDDHAIDLIYRFDASGPSYTDVTALANHNIFPAAPAVGDIYYVGSDNPFFHVIFNIGTASVETGVTYVYEYSNGAAGWPDFVSGSEITLYPNFDIFDQTGIAALFFRPVSGWAAENVNGQFKFWIRIRITAVTTYTTPPANSDYVVYNQRQPYAILNANELLGDVPPLIQLRMLGTYLGDENPEMGNISRILVGAKSRNLDEFNSHLNAGGDGMPPGWAVTYGTDTSSVAQAGSPGGDQASCTFATDTTNVMRVRFTGTNLASAYVGKYRPFLRVTQNLEVGVLVNLRIRINSTADQAPQIDTSPVALEGVEGFGELVDLTLGNYIQIPFSEFYEADTLDGADLIIDVFAQRPGGVTSTLKIQDLILLPVDEWWGEYEDPVTNSDFGTSALRGKKVLIDDGGIVENRAAMFKIDGSNEWLTELWERHGKPPTFVPLYGDTYRLHFIFAYYKTNWTVPPLLAIAGMGVMLEWIVRPRYLYLRGDD